MGWYVDLRYSLPERNSLYGVQSVERALSVQDTHNVRVRT